MKTKNPRTNYISPRTKILAYTPESDCMRINTIDTAGDNIHPKDEDGDDWAASKRYNNGNLWEE